MVKKIVNSFKNVMFFFSVPLAISLVVTTLAFKPLQVNGLSMYPTLNDGEFGVGSVVGTRIGTIKRFDIVTIYSDQLKECIIKRVIGLPGETVQFKDNRLYINGSYVEEPFFSSDYSVSTADTNPVTLGEDEYFCMGDNREHSVDSRVLGSFKKENILCNGFIHP